VTSGSTAASAQGADFIVVVAGLTPYDEGEEYNGSGDRTTFALDGKMNSGTQNALITAVAALGKPMVVVLEGGSVIDMPWLSSLPAASAVVMAWYPGMKGGAALGQLLFGKANFQREAAHQLAQAIERSADFQRWRHHDDGLLRGLSLFRQQEHPRRSSRSASA